MLDSRGEHHVQVGRIVYFDVQGHGFNFINSQQNFSQNFLRWHHVSGQAGFKYRIHLTKIW